MPKSRREPLQTLMVREAEHPGLWLDKYMSQQLVKGGQPAGDKLTPQQQLVQEAASINEPAAYAKYYQRWREALQALPNPILKEAVVQGRMAVGLGGESVLETAITLHHTYGLPYIPGSAVKGLASSYAHQRLEDAAWQEGGEAFNILFGTQLVSGYVTFHDALYIPGTGYNKQPLYPDIITVHHPDYYQQGDTAPADWDSPTPISFLSATGHYLLALSGPYKAWVDAAENVLKLALEEAGAGAQTSSGYGRLRYIEGAASTPRGSRSNKLEIPPGYEQGTVRDWRKGSKSYYGFITPERGEDLFVHETKLVAGLTTLKPAQKVVFRRVKEDRGWQAYDVRLGE